MASKGQEKVQGLERKTGMEKKPRQKLIGGLILLIVLSALYAGCLTMFNLVSGVVNSMNSRVYQMKALSKSTEKVFSMMDSVYQDVKRRHTDKVLLEAAACFPLLEAEPDFQPCMYQDGAIIKVENGTADCPDELLEDIRIDVDQMTGVADMVFSPGDEKDRVLSSVFYAQIDGPFYYVEWEPFNQMEEEQRELFNSDQAMVGIEKAFHVNLLLFPEETGQEGEHLLLYSSEALASIGYLVEDYGITQEMIQAADASLVEMTEAGAGEDTGLTKRADSEAAGDTSLTKRADTETAETGSAPEAGLDRYQTLTIGDAVYEVYLQKYNSTSWVRLWFLHAWFR